MKRPPVCFEIVNRPTRFVNTIQITTHLVGIITGIFILPVVVNAAAGKFRTMNLLSSARTMEAVGERLPPGMRTRCGGCGRGLRCCLPWSAVAVYRQLRHHHPQASGRQGAGEMGLPYAAHGAVCRGAILLPLTKLISANVVPWCSKLFGVDMTDDDEQCDGRRHYVHGK